MINKIASLTALVISIFTLIYFLYIQKKYVYIDTGKLFSEFVYSKDLNEKLEKSQSQKKQVVDSLVKILNEYNIGLRENPKDKELYNNAVKLDEEIYYRKQQFEEENQKETADLMKKVWTRLNDYVSLYGKEKGYDLILGANGQANILYGKDVLDVTNDAISYSNSKFYGK